MHCKQQSLRYIAYDRLIANIDVSGRQGPEITIIIPNSVTKYDFRMPQSKFSKGRKVQRFNVLAISVMTQKLHSQVSMNFLIGLEGFYEVLKIPTFLVYTDLIIAASIKGYLKTNSNKERKFSALRCWISLLWNKMILTEPSTFTPKWQISLYVVDRNEKAN